MDMSIAVGAPILVGVVLFLVRHLHARLLHLEKSHMPKEDVRILIEDKIGGLRNDLRDIKEKINKIFDLYLSDHRK